MKSVLNAYKFPTANPFDSLAFDHNWQRDIDFVLASRLAALFQYLANSGKIKDDRLNILSGHRTTEEQIKAYKRSGGSLIKGIWTGGDGFAARPGESWHEFRMAIDAADAWLKAMEKEAATLDQTTLIKFGLFKPLTKGNHKTPYEDWHMQPIETQFVTDKKIMLPNMNNELMKGSDGFEVIEIQWRFNKLGYKLKPDGNLGIITQGAINDFKGTHNMPKDGKVNKIVWNALYNLT